MADYVHDATDCLPIPLYSPACERLLSLIKAAAHKLPRYEAAICGRQAFVNPENVLPTVPVKYDIEVFPVAQVLRKVDDDHIAHEVKAQAAQLCSNFVPYPDLLA